MQEKRKEARRTVEDPIFVWDNRDNSLVGQVADMTQQGVMLICRKPLEVGSVLYCQMDLPYTVDQFDFVNIELHCKRCVANEVGDAFNVGFEFRNLLPESKTALRKFIQIWRPENAPSNPTR